MASIIITCKGRLAHLQRTLPSVLAQRARGRLQVIVVDYGDPQRCSSWVAARGDPRLWAVRVLDRTAVFNVSRARNIGARLSRDPILAFLDADVAIDPDWLETASRAIAHGLAVACVPGWDRPGFPACVVSARAYHQVRGFDESFQGWGYEEIDFIERLSRVGRIDTFSPRCISVIEHTTTLRTQFYREHNLRTSNRRNMVRGRQRHGPVNQYGYGAGKLKIRRGRPVG